MRILIDLTSLADNFTGIERYAASISRSMIEQDYGNNLYYLLFKEQVHPMFHKYVLLPNVKKIVIPRCNKLLFNQFRLPSVIRKIDADRFLFLAFPVPVLLKKRHMYGTIHDIAYYDCPKTMKTLSKWYFRISSKFMVRSCDRIITISEFSKRRIVERLKCNEEKINVVYCGIDEKFKPIADDHQNINYVRKKYHLPEKCILSLSTLEPRKNLRILIQAYANLVNKNQITIPLVLVGRYGWKMNDLLKDIDEKVREQIIFSGFVEDEDLPYIYSIANYFVFTSIYEGFGIPPLEAMSCRIPVISSDATALPEVLGQAASYYHNNDIKDLEDKMIKMITISEIEKNTMIQRGIEQAQKYNWDVEAQKLVRL